MIEDRVPAGSKQSPLGRELCLDFANTAEWHASEHPKEKLKTYSDLVKWALLSEILSEKEAQELIGKAKREPSRAEEVLKRAIELREAIYHVFSDVAKGNLPAEIDMAVINRNLSRTMARSRLVHTKEGFLLSTSGAKGELDCILDPIVRSAADLLTSDNLKRVKECADNRGCGYLFLDKSRNRSRRWCDMTDCGNRAKAQRFYRKRQKEQPATP
jgi:predicted RNA-binding Zn ribbon-like protein